MHDGFRGAAPPGSLTCLPEDLLLLGARLRDERIKQPSYLAYALAGAVLAEHLLAGVIRLDGKYVQATGLPVPAGHPALEYALEGLPPTVWSSRGATLSTCLHRIRRRNRPQPYLDSLVAAGLLRRDETRFLGLIPVTTHTLTDPSTRASRVARIDATLASPSSAHPRDLALTTLAATVDLTNRLHPTRPDSATRHLLRSLVRADPVSSAVSTSIRRAQESHTAS
ncbi:GOLPH3/VPS74 family protein [Streptacidiphilus jiangxiensis]|uniref:Golgi phosphoprotein 3 (GPP34) n=1 Tax=Streptacidiphilus jiangxiensis TaxID=235985 RepID=A0A1H7RGL6_STRJI|nr:GPP34 family phosphoprotein [Streptacidiphilus jiangxiensis]SEL59376.1 Golgi phosphoprotein 3 (GPP34) [Streptacidiphilus jiangxiensis]